MIDTNVEKNLAFLRYLRYKNSDLEGVGPGTLTPAQLRNAADSLLGSSNNVVVSTSCHLPHEIRVKAVPREGGIFPTTLLPGSRGSRPEFVNRAGEKIYVITYRPEPVPRLADIQEQGIQALAPLLKTRRLAPGALDNLVEGGPSGRVLADLLLLNSGARRGRRLARILGGEAPPEGFWNGHLELLNQVVGLASQSDAPAPRSWRKQSCQYP